MVIKFEFCVKKRRIKKRLKLGFTQNVFLGCNKFPSANVNQLI